MTEIVLTPDQTHVFAQAKEPICVRDAIGNVVGRLNPPWLEGEVIAEAKRRLATPGPRYSGTQVGRMLQALDAEWQRTGGFDKDHMEAFLESWRAGEKG